MKYKSSLSQFWDVIWCAYLLFVPKNFQRCEMQASHALSWNDKLIIFRFKQKINHVADLSTFTEGPQNICVTPAGMFIPRFGSFSLYILSFMQFSWFFLIWNESDFYVALIPQKSLFFMQIYHHWNIYISGIPHELELWFVIIQYVIIENNHIVLT